MTGRRVWWYFVAFFCFILVINAVMIALAVSTHTGSVTDHPYEKGLAYNRVVEAEKKQEMLGWQADIDYKEGRVRFVLRDKDNHPITPEKATAAIIRPTQSGMDFTFDLKAAETAVEFPAAGLWEVRVDAEYQGMHYQKTERIIVE